MADDTWWEQYRDESQTGPEPDPSAPQAGPPHDTSTTVADAAPASTPPPPPAGSTPIVAHRPRAVTKWGRFGGYFLQSLLMVATLYVGWLIWATVLAAQKRGQTPAKQLLGHRVIIESTGQPAGFLRMFFGRGLLVGIILSLAFAVLVIPGIILLLLPYFGDGNKTIWERSTDTLVVYE